MTGKTRTYAPDWLVYGNLGLAFVLELGALVAFALVGWLLPDSWWRLVAGAAGVAVFVAAWARFAAPRAKRRLKGGALLGFKVAVFAVAVAILWFIGQAAWAAVLAVLVAINLAIGWRVGRF